MGILNSIIQPQLSYVTLFLMIMKQLKHINQCFLIKIQQSYVMTTVLSPLADSYYHTKANIACSVYLWPVSKFTCTPYTEHTQVLVENRGKMTKLAVTQFFGRDLFYRFLYLLNS